jgi:Trehalase-like, N-terminal
MTEDRQMASLTSAPPAVASGLQTRYLPIAEHGIIGDLHSAALVGSDGTIDWFCPDRFDGPSVFGALLDRDRGGYYRIAPTDALASTKQLYLPDTNVLVTRTTSGSTRSRSAPAASCWATSRKPSRTSRSSAPQSGSTKSSRWNAPPDPSRMRPSARFVTRPGAEVARPCPIASATDLIPVKSIEGERCLTT